MGLQRRDFVVVLYFKFTIQSIKQNINGQVGFFGNIILIHIDRFWQGRLIFTTGNDSHVRIGYIRTQHKGKASSDDQDFPALYF